MLALEGIKILDLTWQGPGPLCTMILADMGAEVLRIGAPSAASQAATAAAKRDILFRSNLRNKKSLLLNLKSTEGRDIFYKLASAADIVVEGFRPGVAKGLGIDYPTISKINDRVIYCSITGYGQDGPYRDLPGHDINYISFAGVLDLIGKAGRKPVSPLNIVADFGAGAKDAAIGILTAFIARGKTGKGQYIDISLTDGSITLIPDWIVSGYFCGGPLAKRGRIASGGCYPYYNLYKTKDGEYISLGCLEPPLWEHFCEAIGKEEFTSLSMARGRPSKPAEIKKWNGVSKYLEQLFLTRTRDEWFDFLSQRDIAVSKVYSIDEVFEDPQVLHRNMVIEVDHPTEGKVKQQGIAIKLSGTPGTVRNLAAMPGEHTEETLKGLGLGYTGKRIEELRQKGIVG